MGALGISSDTLFSGGLSALGKIGSFFGGKSAAAKQRKWLERMSNTAYQRSMKDMRKAGLNPILAYSQGGATQGTPGQALVPDFDISPAAITGKKLSLEQTLMQKQGNKLDSASLLDVANTAKARQDQATGRATELNVQGNTMLQNTKMPMATVMERVNRNAVIPFLDVIENFSNSAKDFHRRSTTPKGIRPQPRRGKRRWNTKSKNEMDSPFWLPSYDDRR